MARARYSKVLIAAILAASAPLGAAAQGADDVGALNKQVAQLIGQGKHKEAFALAEKALSLAERALGKDHPDTLVSVNNLGLLYYAQGRYQEAEPLYRRALEARERTLGKEHPYTLSSVNNHAELCEFPRLLALATQRK